MSGIPLIPARTPETAASASAMHNGMAKNIFSWLSEEKKQIDGVAIS